MPNWLPKKDMVEVTLTIDPTLRFLDLSIFIDVDSLSTALSAVDPDKRYICYYESASEYFEMCAGPVHYVSVDPRWVVGKWLDFDPESISVRASLDKIHADIILTNPYMVRIRSTGTVQHVTQEDTKEHISKFVINKAICIDIIKITTKEKED